MQLNIFTRVCLLASGYLTGLVIYLFFATYKLVSFQPPTVPPGLLPQWIQWYSPELDLFLYLRGVVLILFIGIFWYLILKKILSKKTVSLAQHGVGAYLRFIGLIFAVLFYFLVIDWKWWTDNYSVIGLAIFILIVALIWIVNISTKSIIPFLKKFIYLFDAFLAVVFGFIIFRILLGVLVLNEFRQGSTYNYLINNDYWAFVGFGPSLFLFCFGLILLSLWIWLKPPGILFRVKNILFPIMDVFIILFILWLASTIVMIRVDDDPELARHNLSTFIGPIADVLAGKSLLIDSPSQYGLLVIYVLSTIFHFLPRMYSSLVWINYIFMASGLILLYICARRWFGWGAIALIMLIFEHYYFATSSNILWNLSQGFIRFGVWLPVFFFLVFKNKLKLPETVKKYMELSLVAVGVFWGFDTGLYGLLAYIGQRSFGILIAIPQKKWVSNFLKLSMELAVSIVIVAVLISIYTYFKSGVWIDWRQYGMFASIYTAGFYVFPMETIGPYILVLGIYGITSLFLLEKVFANNTVGKQVIWDYSLAAYLVSLGLAQFIYFTGHSNTNGNLHTVSIAAIFLFVWLVLKIPSVYQHLITLDPPDWSPVLFWTSMALLGVFFIVINTIGIATVYRHVANRLDFTYPWLDYSYREGYLAESASAVEAYLAGKEGNERRVAIVSTDVTYYIFKTKSANMISYNCNWTLLEKKQVDDLAYELAIKNPEVVFVDDAYHINTELIFSPVRNRYTIREQYGALNMWVRSDTLL